MDSSGPSRSVFAKALLNLLKEYPPRTVSQGGTAYFAHFWCKVNLFRMNTCEKQGEGGGVPNQQTCELRASNLSCHHARGTA